MLRIVFQPAAEAELVKAFEFYQKEGFEVASLFISRIGDHLEAIATSPRRFSKVDRTIRQCVVKGLPYLIFFEVKDDHVRVLSVAHCSRWPGYWRRRR